MAKFWLSVACWIAMPLAGTTLADPCDSPWALDYRYQPGFSEFGVQGRAIDLALYHAGHCVLVVGEDDEGHWVRSYQVQPPALVNLVDERRDFDVPTAIEVSGHHAYVLDAGGLTVLRLGGAGRMYEVGSTPVEGGPICLALDGDRAWAGEGALMSEIDVSIPEDPAVLRTVATPLVGSIWHPARLRAHEGEAWVLGRDNDILYVDGRGASLVAQSVAPSEYIRGKVIDIGWLGDGRRAIAWRIANGLGYPGGSLQFCEADDSFMRIPLDETTGTVCGSTAPTVGDQPLPVQFSQTSSGLVYTSSGRGQFVADAEWQLYTIDSAPSPSVTGDLWQFTYEVGSLGEMQIGRTDAGFIIHAPDRPAPNPVLSVTRFLGPVENSPTLAQNGSVVAVTVPSGVQLIDASDPTTPVVAGLITSDVPRWLKFVEGDPYLYGSRGSELVAWDVSDLFGPEEVGVRSFEPGSALIAAWDGRTAILLSPTGSTTIEAWSPPGEEPALLGSWDLAEPFGFGFVEGNLLGGGSSWLRLDWTQPIVPRRTFAEDSDPDWPWAWTSTPYAASYSEFGAFTGVQQVASVKLGNSPANHFEQVHSRFDGDHFAIGNARGEALWSAQSQGVSVGWGSGDHAGSIDAFVTDFGQYFGFYWSDGIEVGDRFTAIATESNLFLLAPNCRDSDPAVPVAVQLFEVERAMDGCVRITYDAAGGYGLALYRIAGGVELELATSRAESGLWVARDCPGKSATYELRDANGTVYAVRDYASTPLVKPRTRLVDMRPNPFNPQTEIRFAVGEPGSVTLTVFDDRGRLVRTLFDGLHEAGMSSEIWDGRDQSGARVAAGVYFVSLRTVDGRDVAKLALVK